jgi:hypothetical protein
MHRHGGRRAAAATDLMRHVYQASIVRGQLFGRIGDTWVPALFHRDGAGEVYVSAVLPPVEDTKFALSLAVAAALRDTRSVEAVLVAPAWEAVLSDETALSADVRAGTDVAVGQQDFVPERDGVEVLLFLHVGRSFVMTRSAPVVRRPDAPPTLGPLSEIHGEGLEVSGLLTDAMRRGIG